MAVSAFEMTHERILEIGKKQFLEMGYEETSLRELCKVAGITTGSFYRHFADKASLFSALVEDTISGLKHLLQECLEKVYDLTVECPENFYKEHYQRDAPVLLDYIYSYFDTFELLAVCGPKERFREFVRELAMIETEYARKVAADMQFKSPFPDEILLSIHQSFYLGLFEAVAHNIPQKRMEELSKPLIRYYTASWNSIAKEQEVKDLGELGKSQEDYLEAILVLQIKTGEVRSVDVARHMNFSKPSVCHAVKQLKGKGLLDVHEDSSLHLTEEGRRLAEGVYERHRFFTDYLIEMGVSAEQAENDACKIEHIISEESFQALKLAVKNERGRRETNGD